MGSCVSVQREPESAFRLRISFGSKTDKLLLPSSPTKHHNKPPPHTVNPGNSRPGSKEDAFFDSQPWLDSDCEDDFVSVRGDFTPSRGSTPLHPNFTAAVETILDSIPAPPGFSPDSKRMKLSDLFKQSLRSDDDQNVEANAKFSVPQSKSTNLVSAPNSSTTHTIPNGFHQKEDQPIKSTQCCLPIRSFG